MNDDLKDIGSQFIDRFIDLQERAAEKNLPTSARQLLTALFLIDNSTYWKETFNAPNSVLQKWSGLKLEAIRMNRILLSELGFIKYSKGDGAHAAEYSICFDDSSTVKRDSSTVKRDTSPVKRDSSPVKRDIHRHKDIKTIEDIKTKERETTPKKKFQKPSLEEIQAYVKEKGYVFDAGQFFDYYESKGWLVGKSPMKNWKAACSTWNRRELERHPWKNRGREYSEQEAQWKKDIDDNIPF